MGRCLSLCLKSIKIGPFTSYVRFWLFCGRSDQNAKRRCSYLFCLSLFLFYLKKTKNVPAAAYVSLTLSLSQNHQNWESKMPCGFLALLWRGWPNHQMNCLMCSLPFSLFFLKRTKNKRGASDVSLAFSLSQNYQKHNQHAMCRPGASVAEMTQRRRQKSYVFSVFLAFLSLKYQTTIAKPSWVLCFLPRERPKFIWGDAMCPLSLPPKRPKPQIGHWNISPLSLSTSNMSKNTRHSHMSLSFRFLVSGIFKM